MKKVFVVGLCALALCGCSGKKKADSQAAKINVVLDWTANTNHTGLYVAKELMFFANEGLDVSLLQPPEGGALLLVSAGRAQFGIDFQESMAPALAGKDRLPVQAVAAIINHNTSGIMSLAKSNITRPSGLDGKRFASWETPLVQAVIKNIVEGDGGDFSRVTMVPNEAADAFSALQTDVDAIWIYYAWDGIAAETRKIAINYMDLGAINPVFDFYTPIIAANTDYCAENPEIVRAFLRAASRGYEYAMQNPKDAALILLKHAPELDKQLVLQSQEYLANRYKGDAARWGEIDGQRWRRFYRWMYENALLERDISVSPEDADAGFTNEFLP